jgi:hypothetical protein
MSELDTENENETEVGEPLDPNIREALRSLDQIKAERDAAQRELAFAKAGVPSDDPRAAYFVKGYAGELKPEAIKQEWDAAFGTPAAQAQVDTQTVDQAPDLAAQQRVAQASAGSQTAGTVLLEEALSKAQTADEVMAIVQSAGPEVFRAR